MQATIMDADEFCQPPFKPGTILFPGPRNFESAGALCNKFHGYRALMKNQQEADNIISQYWAKINNTEGLEIGKLSEISNL